MATTSHVHDAVRLDPRERQKHNREALPKRDRLTELHHEILNDHPSGESCGRCKCTRHRRPAGFFEFNSGMNAGLRCWCGFHIGPSASAEGDDSWRLELRGSNSH
jgi:hypothetical protein